MDTDINLCCASSFTKLKSVTRNQDIWFQPILIKGGDTMKKAAILGIPVLALVAIAGIVVAQPYWNPDNMTQEQKNLTIQVLELKQEMIQNQIAYLNGEITQEQFQDRLQVHLDEIKPLREQMREMATEGEPCAHGWGRWAHKGFGPGMMGGI